MRISAIKSYDKYLHLMMDSYAKTLDFSTWILEG
jgi:hypothetical protein